MAQAGDAYGQEEGEDDEGEGGDEPEVQEPGGAIFCGVFGVVENGDGVSCGFGAEVEGFFSAVCSVIDGEAVVYLGDGAQAVPPVGLMFFEVGDVAGDGMIGALDVPGVEGLGAAVPSACEGDEQTQDAGAGCAPSLCWGWGCRWQGG